MQFVHVEDAGLAEGEAPDFFLGGAGAGVVPGADDQIVLGLCGLGAVFHVAAIVSECASLVAVVAAGDGEDGNVNGPVLIWSDRQALPVRVYGGMAYPCLERGGWVADNLIKLFVRTMLKIHLAEFLDPERRLTE